MSSNHLKFNNLKSSAKLNNSMINFDEKKN